MNFFSIFAYVVVDAHFFGLLLLGLIILVGMKDYLGQVRNLVSLLCPLGQARFPCFYIYSSILYYNTCYIPSNVGTSGALINMSLNRLDQVFNSLDDD